jgi:hypothetical protein
MTTTQFNQAKYHTVLQIGYVRNITFRGRGRLEKEALDYRCESAGYECEMRRPYSLSYSRPKAVRTELAGKSSWYFSYGRRI